jgi:hypothetical protein
MLTIEARALGGREAPAAEWSIPLPEELAAAARPVLRQVIEAVVRAEVRAFRRRQHEGRLLQVLSPEQVRAGAARGKIAPGGRELDQQVDEDAAVGAALEAFRDGLYLLLIDGEEQRELDDLVAITPDSRLLFVRLSLLAGG